MAKEKKFTDNQLAQLQLAILKDYKALLKQNLSAYAIYEQLKIRIACSIHSPQSKLYGLPLEEQKKVYTVLYTFFEASPQYTRIDFTRRRQLFDYRIEPVEVRDNYLYRYHCYCPTNDVLFTWLLMDSISAHSYHSHSHYPSSSRDDGSALALLILIFLTAIMVTLTLVAMFYLLRQTLSSAERFWFNEGWLQASLPLAAGIASGCASGVLTALFANAPLASLALMAGITNPIGITIFSVICLSVIGAAIGCFITNQIQDFVIKKTHPDAMDPQDPFRFRLTEKEERNLESKGLDPIKVKCAIAALRAEMNSETAPSVMERLFIDPKAQECMSTIRELRQGLRTEVEIGYPRNLKFNLYQFPDYVNEQVSYQQESQFTV